MFDYDIKGKQDLDKIVMQELIKFEASGRTPKNITVSPQMYVKFIRIFPSEHHSVFKFDKIPVIKDESLIDDQIVIQ